MGYFEQPILTYYGRRKFRMPWFFLLCLVLAGAFAWMVFHFKA